MNTPTPAEIAPTLPVGTVVGIRPWLPWPLRRWRWWTDPVPAERLAALRIGLALVLLFDIGFTYLPRHRDFFGRDSMGSPELFRYWFEPPFDWRRVGEDVVSGNPFAHVFNLRWRWSLLRDVEERPAAHRGGAGAVGRRHTGLARRAGD
jgi:hypothetical protein